MRLFDALAALPEKYQPIYRHEELSENSSRPSTDRLECVVRVYDQLAAHLGRPLRVLDIGCAQGFFCFSLAERGALVTGIDMDHRNIDVCEGLKSIFPDLNVNFRMQRAEQAILELRDGQYDVVLAFSVLHHIVHENGVQHTLDLVASIASSTSVLMAEMALKSEPLYWAKSLPEEARGLLKSFPFIVEVGCHDTHLSDIQRPMLVASARYCVLDRFIQPFDRWSNRSNARAGDAFGGSRRYFANDFVIVKSYAFGGLFDQVNRRDMQREREVLCSLPSSITRTALLARCDTQTEGWTAIQRTPGQILTEMMAQKVQFDARRVIHDLLMQLASYEKIGLYHNDVRTWNIVVDESGGATLIDLASLTTELKDCSWPSDIFLSFFVFLHELLLLDENFDGEGGQHQRQNKMMPFSLPTAHRAWATEFWRRPVKEWTFANLLNDFELGKDALPDGERAEDLWAMAIEELCDEQRRQHRRLHWHFEQLVQDVRSTASQPVSVVEWGTDDMENQIAELREELRAARLACDRFAGQIALFAKSPTGLSIPASQLKTVVGEERGFVLRTTGRAGHLAFGPYTALGEGSYKVGFVFCDVINSTGCAVDIVASLGQDVLLSCSPIFLENTALVQEFDVHIHRDYRDVEFRVVVDETTDLALSMVTISQMME